MLRKRNQTEKSVFGGGNNRMKLADLSSGTDGILWVVFVIFLVISIMLLSGHGAGLFPGIIQRRKSKKQNTMKKIM